MKIQNFTEIKKKSHKNNNLWLTMHTIPWTSNLGSELGHIIQKFVVQNSQEPLGPGRWSQWLQWSSCGTWHPRDTLPILACTYVIRASPAMLSIWPCKKKFLTSKFGYLLFWIPTLKLRLKLHRQGILFWWNFARKWFKFFLQQSP